MSALLFPSARAPSAADIGGHARPWRALLGAEVARLQALVDAAVPGCEIIPPHAASTGALLAAGEPLAFALIDPDRRPGADGAGLLCIVQVSLDAQGQPSVREIRGSFPCLGGGALVTADVQAIALLPGRLEARLTLTLENGIRLSAFDPFYWRNRGRYRAGQPAPFRLSALAVHLAPDTDSVDTPPGLAPHPDGRADDWSFRGRITGATPDAARILGRPLWRIMTHIGSAGADRDLVLPVHVAPDALPAGWQPAPEERITGSLWLQARLVEPPAAG